MGSDGASGSWEKYTSRKFIIVNLVLILALVMAILADISSELSLVYIAAISSYGVANAWVDGEGANKHRSRKFRVTLFAILAATAAAIGGVMSAPLSNVMSVAIGAYNLTNAWRKQRDELHKP